jgi:hypothetical protein
MTFGIDDRLVVEWSAVTDGSTATIPLYEGRNQWSSEWNLRGFDVNGMKTAVAMEVPATSLDAYFKGRHVDFIKIDVEGAGTGVVKGLQQILTNSRPLILLEFHGDDEKEAVRTLSESGYRFFDLDTRAEVPRENPSYHVICRHG